MGIRDKSEGVITTNAEVNLVLQNFIRGLALKTDQRFSYKDISDYGRIVFGKEIYMGSWFSKKHIGTILFRNPDSSPKLAQFEVKITLTDKSIETDFSLQVKVLQSDLEVHGLLYGKISYQKEF